MRWQDRWAVGKIMNKIESPLFDRLRNLSEEICNVFDSYMERYDNPKHTADLNGGRSLLVKRHYSQMSFKNN